MRKLNRSGLKAAALEAPPLAIDDAYFSRRVGGLGGGASQRLRRVLDKVGPACNPGYPACNSMHPACNPMCTRPATLFCTRPATPCTQAGLLDGAGKLTEDPRGSAWREAVRAA